MHSGFNRVSEVFFALCKRMNTPVSLGCWLRFKYEPDQLVNLSINPNDYLHAHDFKKDYLVVEYLSKWKGFDLGIDLRGVAVQKFVASEISCKEANDRIRAARSNGFPRSVDVVFHDARRKIAAVLGVFNYSFLDMCKWGPGVSSTLRGLDGNLDSKIREDHISVTQRSRKYANIVVGNDIHWLRARGIAADGPCSLLPSEFSLTEECIITTVPKSAKTDRVIAIEPTLNQYLQGGLGNYIRRRLRRVGIDLNDQTRNQQAALSASKTGDMATVDLSSASDTISRELVYELLPLDWAFLIDDLRSHNASLDGDVLQLQKVSSMGNGFTFELETLVFWALSKTISEVTNHGESRVLVYGDDIILPSDSVPLLLEVFTFCGFSVNTKKTHWYGYFRESCGKHYFDGVDVSPIYQKEVPDKLEEQYRLANRLRRLALRNGDGRYCDADLHTAWLAAIRGVRVQHFVPLCSEEDAGLAVDRSDCAVKALSYSDLGFKLPVLSFRAKGRVLSDHSSLLAYALRYEPTEPFEGKVALRRRGTYVSRRRWYHVTCGDVAWI